MNPQDNHEQLIGEKVTVRNTFTILVVLLFAHTMCLFPFLRRHFGWRSFGWNGLAALVLIFVTAAFSGSPGMLNFLCVWLVMMLAHRIDGWWLRLKGGIVHSRYDGYPEICLGIPFIKTERAAKGAEPLLCMIVGPVLMDYDYTLGCFVFAGFFTLLAKQALDDWINGMTVQQMHDAEIEQRALAMRHRVSLKGF